MQDELDHELQQKGYSHEKFLQKLYKYHDQAHKVVRNMLKFMRLTEDGKLPFVQAGHLYGMPKDGSFRFSHYLGGGGQGTVLRGALNGKTYAYKVRSLAVRTLLRCFCGIKCVGAGASYACAAAV